jgi:hypothetical protein
VLFRASSSVKYEIVETNRPFYAGSPMGPDAAVSPLSAVFTPEIQYWAPLIKAWAVKYQVDPNLIATVIQIESCGDPFVTSSAGAQGLFQVMPFHFEAGEDMLDVQTNAQRGSTIFWKAASTFRWALGWHCRLQRQARCHQRGWATGCRDRYYYWGARIYRGHLGGASPTLDEWLTAGGNDLYTRQ